MSLTRREALALLATLTTGTIFGANRLLAGVANALDSSRPLFTPDEFALLNEIGETIIPTTDDSPGAKSADVATFMHELVRDFYTSDERRTFTEGLAQLQSDVRAAHADRDFTELSATERHAFLLRYEPPNSTPDFYHMLKQLTLWGYFSSEIGMTQAYAHVPVPGRYEACLTIDPATTKPWAE
jgi:hypothetical protein